MNLTVLDWSIVIVVMAVITTFAIWSRKYTKSVADFLAANRCAGRYLMTVAAGMSTLAVVSAVAAFEMYYRAGFSPLWWAMSAVPLSIILTMVGYIIYRFRETRVFTLGQFFEIRYSKNYRKFMGMLAWVSGVINFGIFPAVGGKFFIYFCGLPNEFTFIGIQWSTFAVTMAILLGISLLFTVLGGQIAVMVTDFVQAMFCNIALIFIIAFVLWKFPWSIITEAMSNQPPKQSLLNPCDTAQVDGFGIWYFLISYFWMLISSGNIAWQGSQGYNVSARDAHELRMAHVLGFFRGIVYSLMIVVLAIGAYVAINHASYSGIAEKVNATLSTIDDPYMKKQATVSIALAHIFPVGLIGVLCAIMFAAFVSTHDTYMHSWGSIFIQDVILPFRKKPFTPKQHLRLLRLSIVFVTVLIYIFALFFKQYEYIYMYFWITGAIFTAGVGGPLIGGLYWRRGTTTAAWCSTLYGSTLSVGTIVLSQIWPHYHSWISAFVQRFWPAFQDTGKYPINGYYMAFGIALSSIILYILVSLLGKKHPFNLERMLYRGEYSRDDKTKQTSEPKRGLAILGFKKDMPWKDKGIFLAVGSWFFVWFMIFVFFTIYEVAIGMSDQAWSRLWQVSIYSQYVLVIIVTIWFLIGGIKDFKRMFADLGAARTNDLDDGMVVDHRSLGEELVKKD